MTDPLSVASSAAGIISLGITAAEGLIRYYNSWKDCPTDVSNTVGSLEVLTSILLEIRDSVELTTGQLDTKTRLQVANAIAPCESTIKKLHSKLEKFPSNPKELSVSQKAKFQALRALYPFKESTLAKLRELVSDLKGNLDLALHIANFKTAQTAAASSKQLLATQQVEKRRAVLDWLSGVNYAQQQADLLRESEEGTGSWFIESSQFQQWAHGNEDVLFCLGNPGAGKTFVTCRVIDYLEYSIGKESSNAICYVYCNYKQRKEQTLESVLAGLLEQVTWRLDSLPKGLEDLYLFHTEKKTRPSVDDYLQILQQARQQFLNMFILVDAVDEYTTDQNLQRKFIDMIFKLQDLMAAKIFVTSRPIHKIATEFEGNLHCDIYAHKQDVEKYLDSRIKNHNPSLVLKHDEVLQAEVISTISEKVDGMFLLARLYLDALSDKVSPADVKDALVVLLKGSNSLEEAYHDAKERIEGQMKGHRELAQRVIAWISLAERSLTMLELQHALAVKPEDTELNKSRMIREDLITSVCVGLVVVDESSKIVRFVHYTTQAYFEEIANEWFPNAQDMVAQTCFTYMSFDTFGASCTTDEQFVSRLLEYTFLDYAIGNVDFHVKKITREGWKKPALRLFTNSSKVSSVTQILFSPDHTSSKPRHAVWFSKVRDMVLSINSGLLQATGMHLGVYYGLGGFLEIILQNGFSPDSKDRNGQTPLSWAAEFGNAEAVKLLVNRGDVDVNSKDVDKYTPLFWATRRNWVDIVKILASNNNVQVDCKCRFGRTAFSLAADYNRPEIVKLLIDRDDVDLNSTDEEDETPLFLAANEGAVEIVKLLLDHDEVDINSRNRRGRTPLFPATQKGHTDVVKLLTNRREIKVDVKDERQRTPLCLAAKNGHVKVVKLLMDRQDVKVDSKDTQHNTPFSLAARNGHIEVVKLLLDRQDIDVDSIDSRCPRTPFFEAISNGHHEVVELLIERTKFDVNQKDTYNRTPFLLAALGGHEDVVMLLASRDDIQINTKDYLGCSLWHFIARSPSTIALLDWFYTVDTDVNTLDNQGWTPLHWAAYFGVAKVVEFLLAKGADASKRDCRNWPPFSVAIYAHNTEITKRLSSMNGSPYPIPILKMAERLQGFCDCCNQVLYGEQYHCKVCETKYGGYDLCFRCIRDASLFHPHEFRADFRYSEA